jgi:hypothetical protein
VVVDALLWRQNIAYLAYPDKHTVQELKISDQGSADNTGSNTKGKQLRVPTSHLARIEKISQFAVTITGPATHHSSFHRSSHTVKGKVSAPPSSACCIDNTHINIWDFGCLLE